MEHKHGISGNLSENKLQYTFDTIHYSLSGEKERLYYAYIKVFKNEEFVKIKQEYFTDPNSFPDNASVYIYKVNGLKSGKHTTSVPTIKSEYINKGKSNMLSPFQNAVHLVENTYKMKLLKAGKDSQSEILLPMLASKDISSITYPAYIQPKLDGVRCLIRLKDDVVYSYSRTKKEINSIEHINKEVKPFLVKNPNIILDGEIYNHKLSRDELMQYIGKKVYDTSNIILQYYIYDIIDTSNLNMVYADRYTTIVQMFTKYNYKNVLNTPTYKVESIDKVMQKYNKFIEKGYEGAIVRNIESVYATGTVMSARIRSKNLVKIKPNNDAEFKIVGYNQGNGSNLGALIWVLETDSGKRFKVNPKETLKKRQEMYNSVNNNFNNYKNKLVTVEFTELNSDGIPLCAKAIGIRLDDT